MLKTVLCWSVLAIRKNWAYSVALINSTWRRIGRLIYVEWPFVKLVWQGYCGYSSYVNDALLLARRTRKCSKHFCIDTSCLTKLCHVGTLLSLYIKHGQQCRFFFCINLGFKQFKQYANGEHCACSSCTNSKNNKKGNRHSQMKKKKKSYRSVPHCKFCKDSSTMQPSTALDVHNFCEQYVDTSKARWW